MKRYLDDLVLNDLARKLVALTGPRQVGKTTLARQLMQGLAPAQSLNWDVLADRAVLQRQRWLPIGRLLVLDEVHKMSGWKAWLKGVVDGRPEAQALLVTGGARMETFRQSGESLAGRYFAYRLHPISVREWCEQQGASPEDALTHLLARGGFPEPCLADDPVQADRWRALYIADLVREDVLEFSRVQELGRMKLFVELLRERVGSPLSLASIARDLAVSPATLRRCLGMLQGPFIVFTVQPWHHNIARALLQAPKVYFYDIGLVRGDDGLRFENAVVCRLLKHMQFLADARGGPRSVDRMQAERYAAAQGSAALRHRVPAGRRRATGAPPSAGRTAGCGPHHPGGGLVGGVGGVDPGGRSIRWPTTRARTAVPESRTGCAPSTAPAWATGRRRGCPAPAAPSR